MIVIKILWKLIYARLMLNFFPTFLICIYIVYFWLLLLILIRILRWWNLFKSYYLFLLTFLFYFSILNILIDLVFDWIRIKNIYCILIVYIVFVYFIIGLSKLPSRKLSFAIFFEISILAIVHFIWIAILTFNLFKPLSDIFHVKSLICLSV